MPDVIVFWFDHVVGSLKDYVIYASIAFLLFYVILQGPMSHRKIQGKFPKLKDYRRDFLFSMLTISIFAIVSLLVFEVFYEHTRLYNNISDRSIGYYIGMYVVMLFVHDTYFYWIHRLMHQPKLYRYIHLVHHKSTNPSPWTAYAFHPLEALLEVGILPLLAFTFPIHAEALGWFFLFQILYNIYGHLGYELFPKKFHKTWIGRYVNTSVAHNIHHKRFTGNFGLYFIIWDRILGTVHEEYDQTYEQTTERPRQRAARTAI